MGKKRVGNLNNIPIIQGNPNEIQNHSLYLEEVNGTYSLYKKEGKYKKLLSGGNFELTDTIGWNELSPELIPLIERITYKRNVGTKRWGTICLPFTPDPDPNIKYYRITKYEYLKDIGVTVEYSPLPNIPYLFQIDKGDTFIATASKDKIVFDVNAPLEIETDDGNGVVKGVYHKTSVYDNEEDYNASTYNWDKRLEYNPSYISDGKIYASNQWFNVNLYRCYIETKQLNNE